MIMLGVGLGADPPGSWTKPTKSASVDRNGIHGHIFVMSLLEKRFIAYEYREGPPTDNWKHVHPSFFSELAQYLVANDLANVLGLQVLDRPTLPQELMMEFVLGGESTVMLRQQNVNHGGIYRMTGWSFGRHGNDIISVKGGEAHAKTTKGTHRAFINKKPLPTVEEVKHVLREEGII